LPLVVNLAPQSEAIVAATGAAFCAVNIELVSSAAATLGKA
jgi:hypothetical protein